MKSFAPNFQDDICSGVEKFKLIRHARAGIYLSLRHIYFAGPFSGSSQQANFA